MSQSDSDDLFGDDDAFFEQKKQEMIQNAKNDEPDVDPDFLAQFDPKSPTYHGGGDARPVPLGGTRLPASLAKEYGNVDWRSMPIVEEKEEDPDSFGPAYAQLFRRRQSVIEFKKALSTLQTLMETCKRDYSQDTIDRIEATIPRLQRIADSHSISEYQQVKETLSTIQESHDVAKQTQDHFQEQSDHITQQLRIRGNAIFSLQDQLLQQLKAEKRSYLSKR